MRTQSDPILRKRLAATMLDWLTEDGLAEYNHATDKYKVKRETVVARLLETGLLPNIQTAEDQKKLSDRTRRWEKALSWPNAADLGALRRMLGADPSAPPDKRNPTRMKIWRNRFEGTGLKGLSRRKAQLAAAAGDPDSRFSVASLSDDPLFTAKCPATLDEYDQTVALTLETFQMDLIDLEADRVAFIRNPFTMVVLLNGHTKEVVGWIDLYHLPEEDIDFMARTGVVKVEPSRLLSYEEARRAKCGYTASFVAKGERGENHFELRVHALIYAMMEFLLKFQFVGTDTFTLYAIGQTDEGDNLLQRLGFRTVRLMKMEKEEDGRERQRRLRKFTFDKSGLQSEKEAYATFFGFIRNFLYLDIDDPPAHWDPATLLGKTQSPSD